MPTIVAPHILILKSERYVAINVNIANNAHVKYVPRFSAWLGVPFFFIFENSTPIIDANNPKPQ